MTDQMMPDDDPRLREAIARLPEAIEPRRDLWPGIRAQLDVERVLALPTATGAGRRTVLTLPWIAVAATLLVFVTASVTWRLRGPAEPSVVPPMVQARPTPSPDFESFASYERSAAELSLLLEQRSERLEPATRAVLERSLRTIDEALQEAREALGRDPASPGGRAFVETAWRQKIDFLRRANAVAALQEG